MYKRNYYVMKTFVSCVKDKWTFRENYFFLDFIIYVCVYMYICGGIYLLVTCIYAGYICMFIFSADDCVTLCL